MHSPARETAYSALPAGARLAVLLCFFVNGALFASWVSRIPAVQAALRLSHGELGLVLLTAAFGSLAAMPLTGWAVARLGSRRVTMGTALIYCATLPATGLAPSAFWLAAALFSYGALYGALDVAMNAQAVAVERLAGRPLMSSFHAFFSVGGLVGAACGGTLAGAGITPFQHFTGASMALGLLVLLVAFPRLVEAHEGTPPPAGNSMERARLTAFPARLLALGALAFCIMLAEGSVADWSAIYLRHEIGSTEAVAAVGFAAFSLAMAALRFAGDALSTRLGPMRLVQAGSLLAATGLGAALLFHHQTAALIGFAAVGAGLATIVPQVFSAAGHMPGMNPGPALATVTTIGYTGFLLGPPSIGFAADAFGLRFALGLVVLVTLLSAVLAPAVRPARGPLNRDGGDTV